MLAFLIILANDDFFQVRCSLLTILLMGQLTDATETTNLLLHPLIDLPANLCIITFFIDRFLNGLTLTRALLGVESNLVESLLLHLKQ